MRVRFPSPAPMLVLLLCALPALADELDLAAYQLVDLTHVYNDETVYWPTSPSQFEKTTLAEGQTVGGFFYSAYAVCTPEHGGTHLDAPVHFAEDGQAAKRLHDLGVILKAVQPATARTQFARCLRSAQ